MKGVAGVIAERLRDEVLSVAGGASADVDDAGGPPPFPPRPVVPPPLPEPETLAQAAPEAAVAPPPAIPDPDARFVPLPEGGGRPVLASLAFEEAAGGGT